MVKQVEPKLTPALRRLLEMSLRLETTKNKQLALALECSEETIKSGFRRLAILLETHSRSESLLKAIRRGWIHPEVPRSASGASARSFRPRAARGKGGC
jgi:DNA-binding NarL/FixJ family response regulator